MINLFERLPGLLWGLVQRYPFLTIALALLVLAGAYLVVMKLSFALEDARDIRKRRRDR